MKPALILVLFFTFLNLSAQTEILTVNGHFMIGGSLSGYFYHNTLNETYNSTENATASFENDKITGYTNTISFNPSVGYFILNGLAVGISFYYSVSNQQNQNSAINGYLTVSKMMPLVQAFI